MYRFALVILLCVTTSAFADNPPGFQELDIGDTAPDFKLPGIDGRDWTLKDFADSPLLMVYFTCLLYTSPSPRDRQKSRMPSSA